MRKSWKIGGSLAILWGIAVMVLLVTSYHYEDNWLWGIKEVSKELATMTVVCIGLAILMLSREDGGRFSFERLWKYGLSLISLVAVVLTFDGKELLWVYLAPLVSFVPIWIALVCFTLPISKKGIPVYLLTWCIVMFAGVFALDNSVYGKALWVLFGPEWYTAIVVLLALIVLVLILGLLSYGALGLRARELNRQIWGNR